MFANILGCERKKLFMRYFAKNHHRGLSGRPSSKFCAKKEIFLQAHKNQGWLTHITSGLSRGKYNSKKIPKISRVSKKVSKIQKNLRKIMKNLEKKSQKSQKSWKKISNFTKIFKKNLTRFKSSSLFPSYLLLGMMHASVFQLSSSKIFLIHSSTFFRHYNMPTW